MNFIISFFFFTPSLLAKLCTVSLTTLKRYGKAYSCRPEILSATWYKPFKFNDFNGRDSYALVMMAVQKWGTPFCHISVWIQCRAPSFVTSSADLFWIFLNFSLNAAPRILKRTTYPVTNCNFHGSSSRLFYLAYCFGKIFSRLIEAFTNHDNFSPFRYVCRKDSATQWNMPAQRCPIIGEL